MDYLKLRLDWDEITKELSYGERGRLIEGLLFYVKNRTPPTLSGNERFYFLMFKARIDEDILQFENALRTRRKNGIKGGRPQNGAIKTENNLPVSEITGNNLPVFKEKEGEKEKEKKKERTKEKRKVKEREAEKETEGGASRARTVCMKPPTVEEVMAYCLERRNSVDAEAFVAYYTSNGWRVGKNPMKDWRAAIRSWERKNNESSKGDMSYEEARIRPLGGFKHGTL